ncbi:glutaredoxin domain-containing protein [Didymella exigua CBS 183.55]|uniref:Glutaredoxin domain-containing protein n=1 Tax=Didymella exigua CBS 183.55 TaxID=1150837 RepID=A0A6A5RDQ5_9PLEO|nr:glutaredoxin domain-containing protein [Didymella exigua CBS 183.55]KAF1923847.1 glutaredoxin domain-containing protein [Didymella exigua CBS 183.55]
MPSQRRMRLFGVLFLVAVVTILYMTRSAAQTHASDFYTKTSEALQQHEFAEAAKQRDADSVGTRLKAAEEAAKKKADEKGAEFHKAVEGKDKSVAGRVKIEGDKPAPVPGVAAQGGRPRDQAAMKEHETPEDHDVEIELNAILKKSPVIIFSKSYCPHSKHAKHILLENYTITPAPYVVELDQHPLGARLQDTLAQMTGRRTVPNVLVQGKSIGGGDDMQELDETDRLIDTLRSLGGTRITGVVHTGAREKAAGSMKRRRA